ncbi:MAG: T9SS type A sorting domain-containing protein [Bacteroidia bacterium]
MILSFTIAIGQAKKPIEMIFEQESSPTDEISSVNYDVSPDERPEAILSEEPAKTYYAETETVFEMESAESAFILGKETEIEGFRMANIDQNGQFILMEDNVDPVIYLRFQKLATTQVEIRIYSETGQLVFVRKERYLPLGIEMPVNHSKWSSGTYSLLIKTEQGRTWKKTIVKNDAVVMR